MKIGRSYPGVREALEATRARLTRPTTSSVPPPGPGRSSSAAADVDPSTVPYMSLVIIPGAEAADQPAAARQASGAWS